MKCDFTLKHYENSLCSFLKNDFNSILMSDFFLGRTTKKDLIMRHDIDHDIELIDRMIEIEASIGIKSSNFIRLRAKNYNVFSNKSSTIIQKILSLGHEVGFHYDAYDMSNDRIEKILSLLRDEFGADTFKVVSPHEPARSGNKTSIDLSRYGVLGDAYDDKLMNSFKYISDSSCRWREGCMHNFAGHKKSMYILTHPIWWYDKSSGECY